jgi:hypothetical protein
MRVTYEFTWPNSPGLLPDKLAQVYQWLVPESDSIRIWVFITSYGMGVPRWQFNLGSGLHRERQPGDA